MVLCELFGRLEIREKITKFVCAFRGNLLNDKNQSSKIFRP